MTENLEGELFFRGVWIGLAIAAPVGPIGVLCIRRTLAFGRGSGFISGLGAATADAVYGSIAAFGLTIIANVLVKQQTALQLVGSLFLGYLGLRTILEKPRALGLTPEALPVTSPGSTWRCWNRRALGQDFISTFLLTLTNPMTILSFAAIFAGLGAVTAMGGGVQVVAGVFCGSALWWLTLSLMTGFFRVWLVHSDRLFWVNWVSGAILLIYAILALVDLVWNKV
jgi:threonine/homoserine/homoserine lactone efflux protein